MTGEADNDRNQEASELTRYLEDWTALWREELQAQASDPDALAGAMELWRAAMTAWTNGMRMPPALATGRERTGSPRAEAPAAASVAVDAAVGRRDGDDGDERLRRRIAELEARLARLEADRG